MKPSWCPDLGARRPLGRVIALVCLTLSALVPVAAQNVDELLFTPAQPTSLDPIHVIVSGEWPTECAPELFDLVVQGSVVRVEIAEDVVLPCEDVATQYMIEAKLPPLAAGEYDLDLIYWGPFAPTELGSKQLVVREGSETGLGALSVHPPQPSATDRIQIVASGDWMDGCVPEWSATSVDRNEVVISTLTPGDSCVQQITPYAVAATLGPLPAGTYDLTVLVADVLGLPAEEIPILGSRSFTVLDSVATSAVLDDRFEVKVDFKDKEGVPGKARVMSGALPSASEVVSSSGESVLFWFFSPDNTEVVLKVLDGCGVNDRFWVFASAATDLEFTITVTDLVTSEERTYESPGGQAATAINDTDAFATCAP